MLTFHNQTLSMKRASTKKAVRNKSSSIATRKKLVTVNKDITEKKRTEGKLIKANRLYVFISQVNQLIFRAKDEKKVFEEVCKIAIETGNFKMAWIGLIDPKTRVVKPIIHKGFDLAYLASIKIIADQDKPEGRGPAGLAIKNGKYSVCNDIATDPKMRLWKKEALKRGYYSSISLPIRKSSKIIGTFTLYAGTRNFFTAEEIALLEEVTSDISFALDVLEKEVLRKKAEQAVLKSEKRYQTLTEISPVGIFHTDTTGYTTYVNPRWCEISGLSKKAALGNGWLNAVHAEDRQLIIQGWADATKHHKISLSEYRFVRPDGSIAWVMGQAIPEKNAKKEIIGYVGTTTDITERKKAEIEIATVYKEKQTILNRINDAMVSLDTEWRYTFLNDAALATHPQGRDAILGKTIWEVHPEMINTKFSEKYYEAMRTKKVQQLEDYYAPMDFWFSVKVYPSDDGITIFYTDITENKKAEAEIIREQHLSASIINSLPGIFYLYNKSGRFLRWNKNFEKVSGYSSEEIRNMQPLDFFAEPDKALMAKKINHTFTIGEDNVQANFYTKAGNKIPYYFTGVTITYQEMPCLMGVGLDFSERVRIQEEVNKTSYQLQELTTHLQTIREEERKRIGREIHDELGQQLTAIKMDIAWIGKKIPAEPKAIKDKLVNVIQLLDGSNLAIRRILNELRPAILDEHGLLDALQWHNRQFMQSTGININFTTDNQEMKVSEQIATCIFRVYQEALTNVSRHAGACKVVTSIHISGDNIFLSIEDDGKGFDIGSVKTDKSFGLLGMRERVRALNGSFDIASGQKAGTKIIVRLPLNKEHNNDENETNSFS